MVASGNIGRQRLMAAMNECGRWRLTVVMDGSCVSGGQLRRRSLAAEAVAVTSDVGNSDIFYHVYI